MTNFDYLKEEPQYNAFSNVAISAERIILADPQASIINSRRAMEFAVKWIYSVDKRLDPPYQETLVSLMGAEDFRQFVGNDIYRRMDYIRRCGNDTAHTSKNLGFKEAMLCLENLSIFLDYVACCYSKPYTKHIFDKDIILNRKEKIKKSREENRAVKEQLEAKEIDLQALIKENADLREQLSARSEVQKDLYVPSPLEKTEYETRKLYIDEMLRDAGWIKDKDWVDEVDVEGMPGRSGKGRADYVLYDDMLKPLAIVEAKKTCEDLSVGRIQAKLYADYFEEKYGRRPVIFLTNGFETRIIDGQYPERICSQIYSKRDLEKWFNLMSMRTSLKYVSVDKEIAGRYYQEEAIKRVCESFDEKNRRKALLVMATGSGKTRTVIALCKILLDAGWVKNILFLADRNSLVVQAKRNFVNLLPKLSCTNLVEEKDNYNARCVFSTYQTMINKIDSVKDEYGKIFSCGHFDLIICDEAHRSIYNKYKDIFNYFDAPLVGLTATPKDEIDKNTYDIFELEKGVPTSVNGKQMKVSDIIRELNRLGGKHGIGIIDIVENRVVGMKSRGVYETPGGTILMEAHKQLEELVLDRATMETKKDMGNKLSQIVYEGKWFTPLCEAVCAFVKSTQEYVTGEVKFKLYKGNIIKAGTTSPYSLYSESLASFTTGELYDHHDADGFITLFGLPLKVRAMKMLELEKNKTNQE